jgi:hypothetical protein
LFEKILLENGFVRKNIALFEQGLFEKILSENGFVRKKYCSKMALFEKGFVRKPKWSWKLFNNKVEVTQSSLFDEVLLRCILTHKSTL